MSENINLGSFEIDLSKVETEIVKNRVALEKRFSF